MTTSSRKSGPPSLDDLMTRFLASTSTVADAAIAGSEVEPHEPVGGFHTPSLATWQEAMALFSLVGVEPEKVACPPEWTALAARDTHATLVPLAAGFYPQAVNDLSRIRFSEALGGVSPVPGFPALRGWVRTALRSTSPTKLLLASGIAASLGDEAEADAALAAAEAVCTGAWRTAWLVQKAAVLAARGSLDQAAEVLAPSGDHAVIALNRGLVNLFRGQAASGLRELEQSTVAIPDSSGWRHLMHLYGIIAKSSNS